MNVESFIYNEVAVSIEVMKVEVKKMDEKNKNMDLEWVRVSSTGVAPGVLYYVLVDKKGRVKAELGYAMYANAKGEWFLFDKILLRYKKGKKWIQMEFDNFEELNDKLRELNIKEF